MEKYVINGGRPLKGTVQISGAKNAALGIIAASIMTDEPVVIENMPDVNDIGVMLDAIVSMGGSVERQDAHTYRVCGENVSTDDASGTEILRRIRAGYYFIGAMLGKNGYACVPLPGGCNIGSRPIDQHIKGFTALGADVKVENGVVIASVGGRNRSSRKTGDSASGAVSCGGAGAVSCGGGGAVSCGGAGAVSCLHGAHIYFDVVSVGATINVMMAASMAEGQTIMENVAKEPHIVDVANFLNSMGANIRGAGTDTIRIRGVKKLHRTNYAIIPDQIEAGTFMCMAAATRGDVIVNNVIPKHLESITAKLREMGNVVFEYDEAVEVIGGATQKHTDIKTLPYPGFPTDMQPQITTTLCLAKGTSIVTESIFESRFKYVDELRLMGADIMINGNVAVIRGVDRFTGAYMEAPDLRAGAALVMAALAAGGQSTVENISYILRGYENFDEKLRELGGDIVCINS